MKPKFSIRDFFWLVLVIGLAFGWWQEHRASSLVSKQNRVLQMWVDAAKGAGWQFAYGKGGRGETIIIQPPR